MFRLDDHAVASLTHFANKNVIVSYGVLLFQNLLSRYIVLRFVLRIHLVRHGTCLALVGL